MPAFEVQRRTSKSSVSSNHLRAIGQPARMSRLHIWVLALEPHANGLAFAAFAEGGDLVDWGNFEARGPDGTVLRLKSRDLIYKLMPAVVAVEDVDQPGCKRSKRVRDMVRTMCQDALDTGHAVARVPRSLSRTMLERQSKISKCRWAAVSTSSKAHIDTVYRRTPAVAVRKSIRVGFAVITLSQKQPSLKDH